MFSKTAQKNKAMAELVRVNAVALFFYNKWYHNYVKYICFHIYVTSFLKIIYKENLKSVQPNLYIKKI